jgi:hypothetical protein
MGNVFGLGYLELHFRFVTQVVKRGNFRYADKLPVYPLPVLVEKSFLHLFTQSHCLCQGDLPVRRGNQAELFVERRGKGRGPFHRAAYDPQHG